MLPNLLIIGAMKCGTTSLHNYLNLHPEIYMQQEKELDYFIEKKNYKKGLNWYKSKFNSKNSKILGESSLIIQNILYLRMYQKYFQFNT